MKYYIIAGEASGDLHASNLMRAILEKDSDADFRYFGGDLMQARGGKLVKHYREMAFMGFVNVIKNLPAVLRNMSECKKDIVDYHPDVLILVDYPSFNLKIAQYIKEKLGIPVYYYISPKIWAWKEWRIKKIKRYIDRMFSILPFEVDFYNKHNYKIDYVGNPTYDELHSIRERLKSREELLELNSIPDKPIIAILAGSRRAEVRDNLHIMMEALRSFPEYQGVVAGAPGLDPEFYNEVIGDKDIKVIFGQTYDLLVNSRAALVTSGTATLETAILNTPQVVCYQLGGGKLFYTIMESLLKVKYVSLVTLIVDKPVVPELLGFKLPTAAALAHRPNLLPAVNPRHPSPA